VGGTFHEGEDEFYIEGDPDLLALFGKRSEIK